MHRRSELDDRLDLGLERRDELRLDKLRLDKLGLDKLRVDKLCMDEFRLDKLRLDGNVRLELHVLELSS